jgi:hypothetical protein
MDIIFSVELIANTLLFNISCLKVFFNKLIIEKTFIHLKIINKKFLKNETNISRLFSLNLLYIKK